MERENQEDLCLGPRGFAKSTVRVVIFSIVSLIEDPNDSILIISDTEFQAIHFMSEIKMILETNMELRLLYPYLAPGKKWTDKEITIIGMTEIRKVANVTALGYGGALTGLHFKKIIVDDIVDFENSRTKYQRDKLLEWMGMTLRHMKKPGGEFHYNGTRYHPKDLYGIQLKAGIKTNEGSHRSHNEKSIALWPEFFPMKELMIIKSKPEMGSLRFNAQMQNDVTLMAAGKMFKREYFQYFDKIPEGLAIYQTCDLAVSLKQTADYFVILTFGINRIGDFYIINVYRARLSFKEQVSFLINNYHRWKALRIGIESTQCQVFLTQTVDERPDISARPLYPEVDKVTRSIPMQTKYENMKVWHYSRMVNLEDFEDELTMFNEGEHDDMVDCVSNMPAIIASKKAKIYVNR